MKQSALKNVESHNHVCKGPISLVVALIALTMTTSGIFSSTQTLAQTTAQESKQVDVRELKVGESIERELAGVEGHSYRVMLTVGQYLRVVVEQKGIDVVVRMFGPDGQKLSEVDKGPTPGFESILTVANASGAYRVEVQSSNKDAKVGTYEIKTEELREATSKDRILVVAQKAFEEANQLRDQQTAESRRSAITKYEEALNLFRRVEDRQNEAHALTEIGSICLQLSEPQKALDYFGQAMSLYRAVGNRLSEASTLTEAGLAYWKLGEMPRALAHYDQALTLSRAVKDRKTEAFALANIGQVYISLGEPYRGLDYYHQSLRLQQEGGDRRGEAYSLINIGVVYESVGEFQRTLEYYGQALPLLRLLGDRPAEGAVLNNIGFAHSRLGESPKALEYYGQSLRLFRVAGDRFGEGYTLDNMAQVYYWLGEPQKALQHYEQALEIRRAIADRKGKATTLHNIGRLYASLGEPRRALEYFDQSLSLKREVGDRKGQASTLDSIGVIYFSLGELQRAFDYHNQSLSLRRAVGDRYGEAYALANLGVAFDRMGELQKALEYFERALKLSRTVGDRPGEMSTLHNIGSTYSKLGEADKALEYYTQALALSRALRYQNREAAILLSTARVQRDRGDVVEARRQVEDALNIIESTRTKVTSRDLGTSYLASKQDYYEFYVDLLMTLHRVQPSGKYDVAAFGASERGRARSLLELLVEARIDIRQGVDLALLESERSTQQQLNASSEQLTRLLSGKHTEEQEKAARKKVEALIADYQDVQAQIRTKSPRYAALTQPQPSSAKQIQGLLDDGTLLLEYALGEERSYLWAVTPSSIRSFELPKRSEIEALVRPVYNLLTARNQVLKFEMDAVRRARLARADNEYPHAAAALSRVLLSPVASQMRGKRLLIVTHGVLQYLPFAALSLPDSGSRVTEPSAYVPLIARHEVVSLPSASILAELRKEITGRKPAPKTVAVLADPVFDKADERVRAHIPNAAAREVTRGADTTVNSVTRGEALIRSVRDLATDDENPIFPLARLPFTRREAEAIIALAPAGKYEKALDFDASRAAATDPRLGQYRYVHFATHVVLNTRHPELSGIVLSLTGPDGTDRDGFLLAHEVYNLKLPAELVVLSGCRTGLGKEVKGEGLQSLTRGFMYAGSPRVVVSLWDVNDRSTAELMTRFYGGMLGRERLSPAAALRRAQLGMWRSGRWRAPYYWAAFGLHGEYR